MDMQNEDKPGLSEPFDSSTSGLGISQQSPDRDHGERNTSHEVDRILAACKDPHDLDLLIQLATSTGGLINDELRKVACKSLTEPSRPYSSTLTALEGRSYLVTGATSPSSPALLAPGGIFQAIKMNIRSSLT